MRFRLFQLGEPDSVNSRRARPTTRGLAGLLSLAGGVGAGCLLAMACGVSEVPDQRRELMRSWGEDFLLVEYQRVMDRGEQLQQRVVELCDAPSASLLQDARDVWWEMREPWKRAEPFAFGPYEELPDKLGAFIDFWPARPASVLEVLEADEEIDVDKRPWSSCSTRQSRATSRASWGRGVVSTSMRLPRISSTWCNG